MHSFLHVVYYVVVYCVAADLAPDGQWGRGLSDRCVDPNTMLRHSAPCAEFVRGDSGVVPADGGPRLGFRLGRAAQSSEEC